MTMVPIAVAFVVVDIVIELHDDIEHRIAALQASWPSWKVILGLIVAMTYVSALEAGRLVGHLQRAELSIVTKRFDWHVAKLPDAPINFKRKERRKFILMVACALAITGTMSKGPAVGVVCAPVVGEL